MGRELRLDGGQAVGRCSLSADAAERARVHGDGWSRSCGASGRRRRRSRRCRGTCRACGSCSAGRAARDAPAGYVLEVAAGALDAQRFERLCRAGRRCSGRGPRQERGALLGEALALWRGPALAEFGTSRSRGSRRRGWRSSAGGAGGADRGRPRARPPRELVGELEALVAEHPHRERLRGQLMLALYRSGRQAEALAGLPRCAGGARRARARAGRGAEAARAADPDPGRGARASRRERPRLGGGRAARAARARLRRFRSSAASELAALRALLERAERAARAGSCCSAARPAAGKTRLVRELAHEAADRGRARALRRLGRGGEHAVPAAREWLEFLLRVCDPSARGVSRRATARCWRGSCPSSRRLTGTPAPPPGDPRERPLPAPERARPSCSALGQRTQPLLLVADDVHWADGETLQLLRRLARDRARRRGCSSLAAYRDRGEEIEPRARRHARRPLAPRRRDAASLGKLSDRGGGRVRPRLDRRGGERRSSSRRSASSPTARRCCSASSGATCARAARSRCPTSGVRLSRPLAELRGPERIRDLVAAAPVAPRPRRRHGLLELAAVPGRASSCGSSPRPPGSSRRGSPPRSSRRPQRDRRGAARAGARLPLHARARAPRRLRPDHRHPPRRAPPPRRRGARALHAADTGRVLPELAHHFTLAAPVAGAERAVDYNLRAADAAIAAAAYDEAAARLSSALELGIADPRERARVQVELGYLLYETGRIAEAEAILAASLDAATDLEERGLAARALARASDARVFADSVLDVRELEPGAKQAIETSGSCGDRPASPWPDGSSPCVAGARVTRLRRMTSWSARSWTPMPPATGSRSGASSRRSAVLCDGPAPVGEAIRRCEDLLRAYGGDLVMEGVITRFLSLLLAMAGRFDEARAHVERSSVVLDELGLSPRPGCTGGSRPRRSDFSATSPARSTS